MFFFWGYKSRRAKRVGKSGKWPSSQPLAQRHVGVRNIRRTGLMKRGAAFDAYIITYIYIYTRVYIDRDVHINVYIWFITSSLGSFRNVLGFQLVCLILGCLPMHNLRSAERDKDRERKRLPEA